MFDRYSVASMPFLDASPWRYESLLPTAAKVTKSAVLDLIALRVPAAFFEIILQRAAPIVVNGEGTSLYKALTRHPWRLYPPPADFKKQFRRSLRSTATATANY